jgi:hypothetical protein
MTMRERQRQVQLYRGQVPSPGRPTTAWREDRVRFWAAIGPGIVVFFQRFAAWPRSPWARISRATRLRECRRPSAAS